MPGLNELLKQLREHYRSINIEAGEQFFWSPENKTVYYDPNSKNAVWSLLHEMGHMLSGHDNYRSDIGLLAMEVAAWQKARTVAAKYNLSIDESHVEKCLDSYREWIYRRSSCPLCTQAGIERETGLYSCINCRKRWRVSDAKFCRAYRKTVTE